VIHLYLVRIYSQIFDIGLARNRERDKHSSATKTKLSFATLTSGRRREGERKGGAQQGVGGEGEEVFGGSHSNRERKFDRSRQAQQRDIRAEREAGQEGGIQDQVGKGEEGDGHHQGQEPQEDGERRKGEGDHQGESGAAGG
jgi:hypothetical protein